MKLRALFEDLFKENSYESKDILEIIYDFVSSNKIQNTHIESVNANRFTVNASGLFKDFKIKLNFYLSSRNDNNDITLTTVITMTNPYNQHEKQNTKRYETKINLLTMKSSDALESILFKDVSTNLEQLYEEITGDKAHDKQKYFQLIANVKDAFQMVGYYDPNQVYQVVRILKSWLSGHPDPVDYEEIANYFLDNLTSDVPNPETDEFDMFNRDELESGHSLEEIGKAVEYVLKKT